MGILKHGFEIVKKGYDVGTKTSNVVLPIAGAGAGILIGYNVAQEVNPEYFEYVVGGGGVAGGMVGIIVHKVTKTASGIICGTLAIPTYMVAFPFIKAYQGIKGRKQRDGFKKKDINGLISIVSNWDYYLTSDRRVAVVKHAFSDKELDEIRPGLEYEGTPLEIALDHFQKLGTQKKLRPYLEAVRELFDPKDEEQEEKKQRLEEILDKYKV
jgi:hypothetical protein